MAVDFYDVNDKGRKCILFQLDSNDFDKLHGVLSEFKRLTGLVIDQYGTTRIHCDHVKLIIQIIENHPNKNLAEIKEKFRDTNCDLIAIGD